MRVERIWSMPSRWTFTMKPVRELLDEEMDIGTWCDPFAGRSTLAQIRNDLNPEADTEWHEDALTFLKGRAASSMAGVLFDPPYSNRQASECYKAFGLGQHTGDVTSNRYWSQCKNEVARIVKAGGKVVCFGWNTNGIGITRGFQMDRVLVIAHGSGINDTLVTVETKTQAELL